MRLVTALVVAGVLAGVSEAAAQADQSRVFFSVNGAIEPGKQTFSDDGRFRLYDEDGRVSVSSEVASGPVIDFGLGARVVGGLTVGASFHRTSATDEASVSGQAPHPIFFDRPRSFSATVTDLKRTEQALHLSLGYRFALTPAFDVHVFGGPSQFRFTQDVVNNVSIAESGTGFTTVSATPSTDTRRANAWGGHVGVDASYALWQDGNTSFRLGAYVRYAEAASEFQVVTNSVNTKIGGTQFGAGLRVRF